MSEYKVIPKNEMQSAKKELKAQNLSWARFCRDELKEFVDALIKDVHTYDEYILTVIPICHEFNAAQKRLEDAIKENGGCKFLDGLG